MELYGMKLEISDCSVGIGEYSFNSPQANSFIIQLPLQFLDLIAVNSNLVYCNKLLFQEIPNPEIEILLNPRFKMDENELTLSRFIQLNNLDPNIITKRPVSVKRENAATILQSMIFSFVIYHELGHVRQINSNHAPVEEVIEFGRLNNISSKQQDQLMEVDADIFATNWYGKLIYQNFNNYQFQNTFNSKKEILVLAIYSMLFFFYLSNSSKELIDPSRTHPHPILRLSIVSNYLQTILLGNNLCGNEDEFKSIIMIALAEFDETIKNHFDSSDNKAYYKLFFDAQLKQLKIDFANLLPTLPFLNVNRPYHI